MIGIHLPTIGRVRTANRKLRRLTNSTRHRFHAGNADRGANTDKNAARQNMSTPNRNSSAYTARKHSVRSVHTNAIVALSNIRLDDE